MPRLEDTADSPPRQARPSSGWTKIPNEVVDRIAEVGPAATTVYLALARHANGEGICWPSVARLAAATGLSVRSVQYALAKLCSAGLVTRAERPGRGSAYYLGGATHCTPSTGRVQPVAPHPCNLLHGGVQPVAPPYRTRLTEQETTTTSSEDSWEQARQVANQVRHALGLPAPANGEHRSIALVAAYLAVTNMGREWLDEAVAATASAQLDGTIKKSIWTYLRGCLIAGAKARGKNWDRLKLGVVVPPSLLAKKTVVQTPDAAPRVRQRLL